MADIIKKLEILSDAAKYDVSCSSSGSYRKNANKGLGNTNGMGICHSYTKDGRCVSLLKILLTNYCIYDCSYCVSRRSNDNKKTAFSVAEVVTLTMDFYRRNYIEGLFLSSGIFKNADYTMERLVRVAKQLRLVEKFNGYIHLKTIPGASQELIEQAGLYADRLSINIELPSEQSLKILAPDKNYKQVFEPMKIVKDRMLMSQDHNKKHKAPIFAPAGQSTQMIVGASPETDFTILQLSHNLYKEHSLKRVYYSAYVPISQNSQLPQSCTTSLLRENRLYQADWLMRDYGFNYNEILSAKNPTLDNEIDPKLSYALNNIHLFPVEINKADYQELIRIPGIGLNSAMKIINARKYNPVSFEHLKKIGVALNRSKFFITCSGKKLTTKEFAPEIIREKLTSQNGKNMQLILNY